MIQNLQNCFKSGACSNTTLCVKKIEDLKTRSFQNSFALISDVSDDLPRKLGRNVLLLPGIHKHPEDRFNHATAPRVPNTSTAPDQLIPSAVWVDRMYVCLYPIWHLIDIRSHLPTQWSRSTNPTNQSIVFIINQSVNYFQAIKKLFLYGH